MARYMGLVRGAGGLSRSKIAGEIDVEATTGRCGILVLARVDSLGRDTFEVALTGGSERLGSTVPLLLVTLNTNDTIEVRVQHPKLGHAPGAYPITVRDGET